MWLRTLLLFLLIVFVARALMRLIGGVAQGMGESGPRRPGRRPAAPVKMVADPVCGTFVVPGKALELAHGRETFYFCSTSCRDKWLTRAH